MNRRKKYAEDQPPKKTLLRLRVNGEIHEVATEINKTLLEVLREDMVKGPRKLGLHMSPRHNWQIHRKNEEKNRATPVAIVISHHPAFYLGSLNVSPFGVDDYAKVGAIMGTPLRLTPSETLGEDFMRRDRFPTSFAAHPARPRTLVQGDFFKPLGAMHSADRSRAPKWRATRASIRRRNTTSTPRARFRW